MATISIFNPQPRNLAPIFQPNPVDPKKRKYQAIGDLLTGLGTGIMANSGAQSLPVSPFQGIAKGLEYGGQLTQQRIGNERQQAMDDLTQQEAQRQAAEFAWKQGQQQDADKLKATKQAAFEQLLPTLPAGLQATAKAMGPDFLDEYAKQQTDAQFPKQAAPHQIGDLQKYDDNGKSITKQWDGSQFVPLGSSAQFAPPQPQQPSDLQRRAADAGLVPGTPDYKSFMLAGGKPLVAPPEPTGQGTIDMVARMYIGGDRTALMGLGYGKEGAALRKQVLARAAEMVAQAGPGKGDIAFNRADYKANSGSLAQMQNYISRADTFQEVFKKNIQQVTKYAGAGVGGEYPIINKWIQAGRRATGDKDVAAFDAAIKTASREYARIMSGPTSNAQLTQSAQANADEMLSSVMNLDQLNAVITVMNQDIDNSLQSAQDTMGALKTGISSIGAPADAVPSDGGDNSPVVQWERGPDGKPRQKAAP